MEPLEVCLDTRFHKVTPPLPQMAPIQRPRQPPSVIKEYPLGQPLPRLAPPLPRIRPPTSSLLTHMYAHGNWKIMPLEGSSVIGRFCIWKVLRLEGSALGRSYTWMVLQLEWLVQLPTHCNWKFLQLNCHYWGGIWASFGRLQHCQNARMPDC